MTGCASQPAKRERFSSEADMPTRLDALKQEGRRQFVILYDSKKRLPMLLRFDSRYGCFRTRLVFGSKSFLWHAPFVREAFQIAESRVRYHIADDSHIGSRALVGVTKRNLKRPSVSVAVADVLHQLDS